MTEYEEFVKTLSNHEKLTFDPGKDTILHGFNKMSFFLEQHFPQNILEKLELQNVQTPCAIIHPSAYEFIVGGKSIAITIHQMKEETKEDIALIIGICKDSFKNTSFSLLKNNHGIDFIHEATHIIQNKAEKARIVDEIDAFMNEIMVFQLTKSKNFNEYIITKADENNDVDREIYDMTKSIWDLVIEKDFWEIGKEDRNNWINYLTVSFC